MRYLQAIALGCTLFVYGCQPVVSPVAGLLYLDVKGPVTATHTAGTREGTACAQSILGLIGTGDASIDAAKKAGGITEVSSVDHHSHSVLGLFGKFCTVVKGK